MKVSFTRLVLAAAMCCFVAATVVHADDMGTSGSMQMKQGAQAWPTPGAESKALERFFGANASWTGDCPAGAMGPDSKALKTHGHMTSKSAYGGFWYMCDVEDNMGVGKDAMTWKGHMLVGYDMATNAYRAATVDNMGHLTVMNGTLDGDKFVLETPDPVNMMGQMMKDRLTWTLSSDGTCAFTDEHQMQGSTDWMTAETATMRRMAKTAAHTEKMASSEPTKK